MTKTSMDAGSNRAFVAQTETLVGDLDALLITGFWLTAWVAATAASCAARLVGRLPVAVPLSFAATRLVSYDPADDHPADLDVAIQLRQLSLSRGGRLRHAGWPAPCGYVSRVCGTQRSVLGPPIDGARPRDSDHGDWTVTVGLSGR